MADTKAETKETTVSTPEKKVEEKEKVGHLDEDSKASENGVDKPKENGTVDEKDGDEDSKDATENGDSTDSAVCATKRKSEGGDATDGKKEGASPEKKAKLEEKVEEAPTANGEAEAVA